MVAINELNSYCVKQTSYAIKQIFFLRDLNHKPQVFFLNIIDCVHYDYETEVSYVFRRKYKNRDEKKLKNIYIIYKMDDSKKIRVWNEYNLDVCTVRWSGLQMYLKASPVHLSLDSFCLGNPEQKKKKNRVT